MDGDKLDIGTLFYAMRELALRSMPVLLPVFLLLTAVGLLFDYFLPDLAGAQLILAVTQFVLSYFLVKGLAVHSDLLEEGAIGPGFGAYFGVSFMMGIGVSLGFLLLVIPGIILTVRWLLAFPALFNPEGYSSDRGALLQSWDMTGPVFWKLLPPYLFGLAFLGISLGAYRQVEEGAGDTMTLAALAVANLASATSTVFNLLLGFAAFLLLHVDRDDLARVFD